MTCPVIKYEFFQTKEKEYGSAENTEPAVFVKNQGSR